MARRTSDIPYFHPNSLVFYYEINGKNVYHVTEIKLPDGRIIKMMKLKAFVDVDE